MIPKGLLDRIEKRHNAAPFVEHCIGVRVHIRSLIADARALRELVDALPKCCEKKCIRIATHDYNRAVDTGIEKYCDEHAAKQRPESTGWGAEQLEYAAIVRRLCP